MVNSELSEISYVIQAGVTTYPIGFEYHFNENNSPQLLIKIGESVAIINVDFQLSADESEIILIPTEEEAKAQTSPSDTRWMDRIVGKELLITRDIPFVQASDYSVGRINPEQIEYDFDRAVMRDQEILHQLSDFTVDVALAESLANAAVETANEAATAANQATTTANIALVTANEAKATATQASKDAVDAMADAASAVNKANAADATATTAMETVTEAVTIAREAEAAVANKQDKLVAGQGITIDGNTISATDGYNKTEIDNKISVIEADIDANADAIQKTRADFIAADSDINIILNNHAGELTTLHNDVDAVGDQVSGIEEKIPGAASATNPLVTKQQLLDEEMDIREDLNSGLSELQTQVTAQATAIAGKQKQLQPGDNVFINRTNPNYDTISVANVVSSLNGLSGALNLQAGSGIEIDGLKISATGGGSGGASYTAGDGIDITDNTISVDSSVVKNNAVASNLDDAIIIGDGATGSHGGTAVGAQSNAGQYALALGTGADASGTSCVAIGPYAKAVGGYTYQIGPGTNSDSDTLQFWRYKLVNADGTIPTDRYTTTPTSAGTYIPKLTIAEDGTATREWGTESGGGGGASLPDQTDNAGKFLMTDGSAPKWVGYFGTTGGASGTSFVLDLAGVMTVDYTAKSLVAIAPQANSSGLWSVNILGGSCSTNAISIGFGSQASKEYAVGINGEATGAWSIALGYLSKASAYGAVQLGVGTNSTKNTLQFKGYQVVDADGNIPLERLTNVTNQIGDISTALTAILGE